MRNEESMPAGYRGGSTPCCRRCGEGAAWELGALQPTRPGDGVVSDPWDREAQRRPGSRARGLWEAHGARLSLAGWVSSQGVFASRL